MWNVISKVVPKRYPPQSVLPSRLARSSSLSPPQSKESMARIVHEAATRYLADCCTLLADDPLKRST
jgi:hypothetical protein